MSPSLHYHRRQPDLACCRRQPRAELSCRIAARALTLASVSYRGHDWNHHWFTDLRQPDHVWSERADPAFCLAWRYHPYCGRRLPRLARHSGLAIAAGGFACRRGPSCPGATSVLRGLRVGFLTEMTNPKGIAFFLGLFAAAVPDATPLWAKLAVLSVGGVIEVVWYTAVSFALSSAPMLAGYQKVRRTVDRVFGTLLIVIGLKVAFDAR